MAWSNNRKETIYDVVINSQHQYSLWPEYKTLPNGWQTVGKSGLEPDCLNYLNDIWADLLPLKQHWQMMHATPNRH